MLWPGLVQVFGLTDRLQDQGQSVNSCKTCTWKSLRNKIIKELKNAKREYLKTRVQHKLENSKTLWNGVKDFLGWNTGGSPELIVKDTGEVLQSPENISDAIKDAFELKLKNVEESLGPPAVNYLNVLRNMTRGRCRRFGFNEVTRDEVISKSERLQINQVWGMMRFHMKFSKCLTSSLHNH